MKYLLATKTAMTELFDENGNAYGATILKAGPVTVTQVRTKEKDGYTAHQVGFAVAKEKSVTKPLKGHLKASGGLFKNLKEFRVEEGDEKKVGDTIDVSQFVPGDMVVVCGISKGKGFQGVVKRHGFHGGRRSHGQKHSEREPGSIGASGVQRVFKGIRMGGRMGGDTITVKNLKVLRVDAEKGELYIAGAIPGRRGTLIAVTTV